MIQILEGTSPNVISTKAIGKINKEDQDRLLSFISEKLNERENLCWYLEMEKFVGWERDIDRNNLKENLPDSEHLNKIAIVGARDWQDFLKEIMAPLSFELKFFEAYQKQEAIKWIEK